MTLIYVAIAKGPTSIVMLLFNLNLVIPVILGFVVLH